LNCFVSQSVGICYINSNGLKKTLTAYARMAGLAVPNFFRARPNLSSVNTSRFKPQTTYEKNDCMDVFWQ